MWLLLGLASCGQSAADSDTTADGSVDTTDSDNDGLCDAREREIGTDPSNDDTDGDTLPDAVEFLLGFSALDVGDPGPARLLSLPAEARSERQIATRFTVAGNGTSYRGGFIPLLGQSTGGASIADYYVQSRAVSALPPDNVAGFDGGAQRFVSVSGTTRLTFETLFRSGGGPAMACRAAHPFGYGLYTDTGQELDRETYLLVVEPPVAPGAPAPNFCRPSQCF